MDVDATDTLRARVLEAIEAGESLWIHGAGTRAAFSAAGPGAPLDVRAHRGVVRFEPSELFVTVRGGTPLAEVERLLADAGQMLPFEPPRYGANSTIGGMVAHGASGPRRPFAGALRDHVLGVRLLNGRGEVLRFGGEVMKNVAGYDTSRLQAGGFGAFGVIVEVSLKTVPRPDSECTLAQEVPLAAALKHMLGWSRRALPISALAWQDGRLLVRLSGTEAGVSAALQQLGGEVLAHSPWPALRDRTPGPGLWRLSLPPATPTTAMDDCTLDWGGALRWLAGTREAPEPPALAAQWGGHADWYGEGERPRRAAIAPIRARLQAALKRAFDPHGVFNVDAAGND